MPVPLHGAFFPGSASKSLTWVRACVGSVGRGQLAPPILPLSPGVSPPPAAHDGDLGSLLATSSYSLVARRKIDVLLPAPVGALRKALWLVPGGYLSTPGAGV